MTSNQRRNQARRNGAKAAGTKSPAGKETSSKNALKHGLTSKMIVLANEVPALFEELRGTYVHQFQPANGVEMDLVEQMVAAQWRLRRVWTLQTAAFDAKMDQQEKEINKQFKQIDQPTRASIAFAAMAKEDHALDLYLRYETAYARMYQRALNTLLRLRRETENTEYKTTRNRSKSSSRTPEINPKRQPHRKYRPRHRNDRRKTKNYRKPEQILSPRHHPRLQFFDNLLLTRALYARSVCQQHLARIYFARSRSSLNLRHSAPECATPCAARCRA